MPSNEASPVSIREYRSSDFPALCALDRLCFPEGIAYTPQEIALGLAQRGAFSFVAEAEGRVIAFLLAYQKKPAVGHLVTIDVHPDSRRQGIGHKLMALAEEQLQRRGARRIVLEVSVQNDPALRFYQELGYSVKRLLPSYYQDRSDAYLMEKILR